MQPILGLYINLYAALVLLVVLVTLTVKKDFYSFSGILFRNLIILNVFLLIFEGVSHVIDGKDNVVLYYSNYWFNFLLFLLTPLLGAFWAQYIDFKLFSSYKRLKKRWFYLQPFIIGVVFSIVNFIYPVLYTISITNVYERKPFIYIDMGILLLLVSYILYLTYCKRKEIDKIAFYGIVLFVLFPTVGGVIQVFNYGIISLYSMMALGIFSTYIILETINSSKDYLTKLFTRSVAVDYIDSLITKKKDFAVIMIDIDNFKEINDEFGHSIGDLVLIDYANKLLEVFKEDALVSRFGGDEFLIVCKDYCEERVLITKHLLKGKLEEYSKNFTVEFSYGYSFYNKSSNKTNDDILVEADDNMYKDKAINKNYKRRESDR